MSHMKIMPFAFKGWLISVGGDVWWKVEWDLDEGSAPCLFSVSLVCFFESVNPLANSDETATPWEC